MPRIVDINAETGEVFITEIPDEMSAETKPNNNIVSIEEIPDPIEETNEGQN